MDGRRRIRVLSVIKGLGVGGAEHLLVDQLAHRDTEAFDNHVAFLLPWKDLVVEKIEALGVPVTCLDEPSVLRPGWLIRLRQLLDEFRPDLVHVHSPVLAAAIRPLVRASRRGAGLVYTEHNRWGQYKPPTRWANRLTYGLDDARIAVSQGVVDTIRHPAASEAQIILNGIDVESVRSSADRRGMRDELGIGDDTLVVATVANLRSSKDYPNILAAASRVLSRQDDVVFLSVGHGPDQDELRRLHGELGLGDGYRFLGFRRDAARIMSGSDVFLLGSRHEGLPLALMEAMALGTAVVATTVGGIPEVVDDGVSGVLAPPEDDRALAAALEQVLADPSLRDRLGTAAAARAVAFDSRPSIRTLEDVYRRVVAERARP